MSKYYYALIGSVLLFGMLTVVLVWNSGGEKPGVPPGEPVADGDPDDGPGPDTAGTDSALVKPLVKDPDGGPQDSHKEPAGKGEEPEKSRGPEPLEAGNAELVFVVTDHASQPIGDVLLTLLSGRRRSEQWTDGNGAAVFAGIAAGTYLYQLAGENYPDLASAREVTLAPSERKEIQLRLGLFDQSISGHVRNTSGQALEGIAVRAREQLVQVEEDRLMAADRQLLQAESGPDGFYEITGLAEGDYVVSVDRTEEYPSVRKTFRAGSQSADIVLDPIHMVEIRGIVTSPEGNALEGVTIVPMNQGARQAVTDGRGEYSTQVELNRQHSIYVVTARLQGFREKRVNLQADELRDQTGWELNIVLEPLGALALVAGTLADSEQTPVPGETLHLQSPRLNARYQAVSNAQGRFNFGDVQVGEDYRLLVYPKQSFKDGWLKDHVQSPVTVPENGLELEIVLETVGMGTLQGVMVDPSGAPIPTFTVWVRSMKAQGNSISLTGDAEGRFVVENVPEGEILVETRSLPRLSIRGIKLAAGEEKEAVVVLDWGSHQIAGTVLDPTGSAVTGARVSLHWTLTRPGLQSSSFRNAVTDASGRFVFSELGTGQHRITVNCPGYLQKQMTHEVGGNEPDPVVRLQVDATRRPR